MGYLRALSPEGVLSVDPTLIISEEGAGPPETIDVLRDAAIPFVTVPETYSREGILEKIRTVGDALDVPEKADDLAARIDLALREAEEKAATVSETPKRVLFILSTQGGRIMAAGTNTAAQAIIEMSGGVNAVAAFEGYKQMTDEAVSAAAPDVILMMDRGGDHAADNSDLFSHPGLAATPAAANNAVVRIDGLLLLGFGPRTPEAVERLSDALRRAG